MIHRRFVARLLNRPQLILPAAGAAVMHALLPGARLDGYDGPSDPVVRDPREYTVVGRIAVIPVVGELVHRGGGMDAMSGVCSYQSLKDMLSDSVADPSITGILLDIDSPGGEAGGNLDLAEWIAAQRGSKPLVASVNSLACSGAYSIASAADQVLIGADGTAGSIGVVTYHTDFSRELANDGVVVTHIYAGDRKIDGNPFQPLSPEAASEIQGLVDTIYARFCGVVAANRGMSVQAIRATQAAIYTGQAAVRAGLADTIATSEDALMAVAARSAPPGARLTVNRPAGGISMAASDTKPDDQTPSPTPPAPPAQAPEPQPTPDAPAHTEDGQPGALPVDAPLAPQPTPPASPGYGPADPVQVAEACAKAGFPQLTVGLLRAKASMSAVQADITRANGIVEVAKLAGVPAMADPALAGGVSLETFRAMAFAGKADGEAPISTTVPASATGAAPAAIDSKGILANLGKQREERAQAAAARRH